MEKFARRCNVTGRGMNEGYVVGDGELYFSEEKHLIEWLRSRGGMDDLSDEFILKEAYELGEYYYTESVVTCHKCNKIIDNKETDHVFCPYCLDSL
jgi:hypothetical protein